MAIVCFMHYHIFILMISTPLQRVVADTERLAPTILSINLEPEPSSLFRNSAHEPPFSMALLAVDEMKSFKGIEHI